MQLTVDRDRLRQRFETAHILTAARGVRCAFMVGPLHQRLVRWHAAHVRNVPLETVTARWSSSFEPAPAARRLERWGWAPAPTLPADLVTEVRSWFEGTAAGRVRDPHVESEAVRAIAYDEQLVDVVRRYLGAEPILFDSTIWRSDAVSARGGVFHYDVGDYRSVVVFFYLSDVTEGCGEHAVIEGTHGRKGLRHLVRQRLTDPEAEALYAGRIHRILGPAGTGWFEDLSAFHKKCPAEQPRVILKVCYVLRRDPSTRSGVHIPLLSRSGSTRRRG